MYNTSENGIDHSKNSLDAISMKTGKKYKAIAKAHLLPKQLKDLKLTNLQEVNFKADNIKLSGFEASGVELTCKFHKPNPKVVKPQEIKKEKTIWDKLRLFVVKQSVAAYFQIFIKSFQQLIP